MDPVLYRRDLELKPATLRSLADHLTDVVWPVQAGQRISTLFNVLNHELLQGRKKFAPF
jgi:hypothetical protein